MVDKISLKDFVELPEIMLNNSKKSKYIQLLNESTISCYYYSNLKKDLMTIFNRFKDAQYMLVFQEDYNLKSSTPTNEVTRKTKVNIDRVGDFVEKKVDLNIWSKDIYNILYCLSNQLTFQEALYLVSTFFENKTEDELSDILSLCKKSLYKIKKSCLVKIKLEFDKNNLMN